MSYSTIITRTGDLLVQDRGRYGWAVQTLSNMPYLIKIKEKLGVFIVVQSKDLNYNYNRQMEYKEHDVLAFYNIDWYNTFIERYLND